MTYIFIALGAVILIVTILAFVFNKLYRKYKVAYEQEHTRLEGLQQEYSKLVEAYKIKKKNKESADEKINELHSGDSVTNAINILRK